MKYYLIIVYHKEIISSRAFCILEIYLQLKIKNPVSRRDFHYLQNQITAENMPLVISPEIRRHIAIAKDIMQSPYFFINTYPFIFNTNLDDYTKTEMICQYLLQKYIKKHKLRVNSIDKIGVIVYNKSMNTCSYIHIFKREEKV